jgi:hypothetical protein
VVAGGGDVNDARDEKGTTEPHEGGAPTLGEALARGGPTVNDDAERLATCIARAEALGWRADQGKRPAELVVDAVTWLAASLAAARTADPTKATRVACAVPEPAVVALGARLRAAGVPIWLPGALAAPDGACPTEADPAGADGLILVLDDGATRGAALTWLRERYGHVNLCARMLPTDQGVSWWCYALSASWLEDLPHAPTEQEALVRGAECLAAGRWVTRTPQAPRPRVGGPPPRQRGQG